MRIDIFNGDADGICAMQQLQLAAPRKSELITGVKRDIALLAKLAQRTDLAQAQITVLDVSMAVNQEALTYVLEQGAQVFYADHHKSGKIPNHPRLEAHIDLRPATCTAIIINNYLAGAYPGWAVAAAFGDNFHDTAQQLGKKQGFNDKELASLRELGELLNYNGYGRDVTDLHYHPADLLQAINPYPEPLAFSADSPALATLRQGFQNDMAQAKTCKPAEEKPGGRIYHLPATAWARRVAGVFSNALARSEPTKAHALLVAGDDQSFMVSVRAPLTSKQGAVELCQNFATGGGRAAAAGINHLPQTELTTFHEAFFKAFSSPRISG